MFVNTFCHCFLSIVAFLWIAFKYTCKYYMLQRYFRVVVMNPKCINSFGPKVFFVDPWIVVPVLKWIFRVNWDTFLVIMQRNKKKKKISSWKMSNFSFKEKFGVIRKWDNFLILLTSGSRIIRKKNFWAFWICWWLFDNRGQ